MRKELIYGPPGSGKTTELLALLPRLGHIHHVVHLDIQAYFEKRGATLALSRLEAWEVLAVVGLALYRFGEEVLHYSWETGDTDALRDALQAFLEGKEGIALDIGSLAKDVALLVVEAAGGSLIPGAALALKGLAAVAGNLSAVLPLGMPRERPLPEEEPRVQNLKFAVTRLLLRLQESDRRKVLLVIDGMDRGDASLIQRLFWDSQMLFELPCHQVICAPQSMRVTQLKGFTPRPICNIPVMDHEDPSLPGSGVDFMERLWAQRAAVVEVDPAWIPREHVRRLAWASGGFVREFLNLVRDAAELAWDDDSRVETIHVERVLDEWRRRWEDQIGASRLAALRRVQNERAYDEGNEWDRRLLEERRIVAFPNGGIWYYPHPLLTLRMLKNPVQPG